MVKLPHRIHPKSSSVCLIVKDTESDAEKTVDQFRDMLKEVDVKSVDLILPLDTLKKEWKGKDLSFTIKFLTLKIFNLKKLITLKIFNPKKFITPKIFNLEKFITL